MYCTRCKRRSHNKSNCYAKTYASGKKIGGNRGGRRKW